MRWATILLLAALSVASAQPKKAASSKASKAAKPAVTFPVEDVNDPSNRPDLALKDSGSAALRAQILLDRANFSVGQIDGTIGDNTEQALTGFRIKEQIAGTIGVDQATWDKLNQDEEPALISYEITAEDLKGPFVRAPKDMMEKAKLKHLGYASPLDELGEKFHIAPAVLRQLNPGKSFYKAGVQIIAPNVQTDLQAVAARVVVSKSLKTVTALDDSGNIIAQYPATMGSEHDPLPIGEWTITGIAKNPKFHYDPDLFWDAKGEHSKATIAAGPRNPVGVVWMELSKAHYGIHGTPSPATIGYRASHGCIRLTNWDALELAGLVMPGTPASLVE